MMMTPGSDRLSDVQEKIQKDRCNWMGSPYQTGVPVRLSQKSKSVFKRHLLYYFVM